MRKKTRRDMKTDNVSAVILAAGLGKRLFADRDGEGGRELEPVPKILLEICKRKRILDYQVDLFRNAGVREIVIVGGFKVEFIKDYIQKYNFDIKIVNNEKYRETNNAYSLYLGLQEVKYESVFIANGDCVWNDSLSVILENQDKNKSTVFINSSKFYDDAIKVQTKSDQVVYLSKSVDYKKLISGIATDLYFFDKSGKGLLSSTLSEFIHNSLLINETFETAINLAMENYNLVLNFTNINDYEFIEIDTREDLNVARELFCEK